MYNFHNIFMLKQKKRQLIFIFIQISEKWLVAGFLVHGRQKDNWLLANNDDINISKKKEYPKLKIEENTIPKILEWIQNSSGV